MPFERTIWLVSFHVALLMDEIWHVRNQVLQQGSSIEIQISIKNILQKARKYVALMSTEINPPTGPITYKWSPSPEKPEEHDAQELQLQTMSSASTCSKTTVKGKTNRFI